MASAIACPAGYTLNVSAASGIGMGAGYVPNAGDACYNAAGYTLAQVTANPGIEAQSATVAQSHQTGEFLIIGAVASLIVLPGWWKLLALPLAYFGIQKGLAGLSL